MIGPMLTAFLHMAVALSRRAPVGWTACAVACSLAVLCGGGAHAQRPEPALGQLAHRAWTMRDGAPGAVNALAQTADGFLWLGTGTGLYRFDGVRFEAFEPPAGQALPSRIINMLHAVPDGALWIGYTRGGASVLAGGRLVSYDAGQGMPGSTVTAFARDSTGTMWAATISGIVRLVDGRWRGVGPESGYPGGATADLLVDRRGTLWAAELTGVYALPRGAGRFVRRAPSLTTGQSDPGGGGLREAPDGSVWGASVALGPVQLSDSAGGPPPAGAARYAGPGWRNLIVDRQGYAWRLGHTGQIVRTPLPSTRQEASAGASPMARDTLALSRAAGASGSFAVAGLEDREGNVWLGTEGGLDQLRAAKLTPVLWPRVVVDPVVVPDDSGGVWAGSASGALMSVGRGVIEHPGTSVRITAMSRDGRGNVWVGGQFGLWNGRGGTFVPVPLAPEMAGSRVQAVARDRDGTLWTSIQGAGRPGSVFRRKGGVWERFVVAESTPMNHAYTIVTDPAGRTWFGHSRSRLTLVAGDSVRVFAAGDGRRVGAVTAIHVHGDTAWIGMESGVAYLAGVGNGARPAPLVVASGPLHSVSGIVRSADGDLWLNSDEGVTRVPAVELRRAMRDPAYRARDERFGLQDGLEGAAVHIRPLGTAVASTDGRLWFATQSSVAWLDPRQIRRNALPPPVHVTALAAGGHRRDAAAGRLALPEGTRALSIAYTAPSLAVPERVRFRYRLVGIDTAWQEAGSRREAFYTNLRPGAYRFHVIAANDDGVWNTAGASLEVVIPPTFLQTDAFVALCATGAAGAVWWLAAWRERRVAAAMRARFDATLAERTRVARELHDTLLTGVAGIAMRLDAVATGARSPAGVDVAALDELRAQARDTLVEARQAVVDMRASTDPRVPLSTQLADAARRIFAGTSVDARVEHEGAPRAYPPAVEEQVLRITAEALTNARDHAGCRAVVATCTYGRRELRVRVRDDGRGFDPARAAPSGHFGLAGMRERAEAVGARLTVESAPGRGTEVQLVIRRAGELNPRERAGGLYG
jgi:signal transduction histidine kinase/ligand-binding sensor domain-containing protein